MAITTMAMVTTVFVLNLYSSHDKPVPRWVKRLLLDIMAPLLCMCTCTRPVPTHFNRARSRQSSGSRHRDRRPLGRPHQHTDDVDEHHIGSSNELTRRTHSALHRRRRHALVGRRAANVGANAKQWVYVATVCDRLFFWICLICIVITTMILFHPLMFKDVIQVY